MKKKLIIVFVLSLCLGIATGCGCKKKKDKKETTTNNTQYQLNTRKGVVGDKEMNGLTFTNTSLKTSEYSSTLVTKVTNTTDKDIYVRIFNIHVKDKDGNNIVTIHGYVGGVVPANSSRDITSGVDLNLADAYKVEYELVEK